MGVVIVAGSKCVVLLKSSLHPSSSVASVRSIRPTFPIIDFLPPIPAIPKKGRTENGKGHCIKLDTKVFYSPRPNSQLAYNVANMQNAKYNSTNREQSKRISLQKKRKKRNSDNKGEALAPVRNTVSHGCPGGLSRSKRERKMAKHPKTSPLKDSERREDSVEQLRPPRSPVSYQSC